MPVPFDASGRAVSATAGLAALLALALYYSTLLPGLDFGDTASFLCSDLARGITGEVIHVDSGFHVMGIA